MGVALGGYLRFPWFVGIIWFHMDFRHASPTPSYIHWGRYKTNHRQQRCAHIPWLFQRVVSLNGQVSMVVKQNQKNQPNITAWQSWYIRSKCHLYSCVIISHPCQPSKRNTTTTPEASQQKYRSDMCGIWRTIHLCFRGLVLVDTCSLEKLARYFSVSLHGIVFLRFFVHLGQSFWLSNYTLRNKIKHPCTIVFREVGGAS